MTGNHWPHSTMPAEARLIAACGVDPNTVLAEPLRINGQRITFRRIVRLDGSPRINRAGTGLVTRPRTVWAPLDALTRYRGEVTR